MARPHAITHKKGKRCSTIKLYKASNFNKTAIYICAPAAPYLFLGNIKMTTDILTEVGREKELRVYLPNCPKLSKISCPQIAVIH